MNHTAYINPKMIQAKHKKNNGHDPQTIHVNPNFSRAQNVYVNPRFVVPPVVVPLPAHVKTFNEASAVPHGCTKYSWRKQPRVTSQNFPTVLPPRTRRPSQSSVYLSPSGKKLIRKSVKSSAPKPFNQEIAKKHVTSNIQLTKFKLDKRPIIQRRNSAQKKNSPTKRSRYKIERLFPKNTYSVVQQKILKARKRRDLNCNPRGSANQKLITIGGILYRATSNKLTRAAAVTASSRANTLPKAKAHRHKKLVNKHVINVRGERFALSRNGATLQRLPTAPGAAAAPPRERVYFGGATFRQASGNVLVRTRTHLSTQAKQRSIAFLAARRRKINTPCTVFRKLGRCHRFESNMCVYTHEKKNVDLCKRFLRRECLDSVCLLSHDAVHQKVPTCRFFLEGTCHRDHCPYLHVKVSGKADVCPAFLQGYCDLGDQCARRHVNICPDFEKLGSCKKGRECPYPHRRQKTKVLQMRLKFRNPKLKRSNSQSSPRPKSNSQKRKRSVDVEKVEKVEGVNKRYYAADTSPGPSPDKVDIVPTRQRLLSMPSFIAFE